MLRRVIQHEWLLLRRDPAPWLMTLLFAACIGYAVFTGASGAEAERKALRRYVHAHETLIERYRLRAEAIERVQVGGAAGQFNLHKNEFTWGPRQPAYVPAWAPFFAALPPASTAALAVGQRDIYPAVFTVRYNDRKLQPAVEPNGNPLKLLIGHFDPTFVVLYLLPLFILALSYDLLSAEREQGTLALVLSQPVQLSMLVLSKVIARAVMILGTTVLCASIALILSGVAASGPDAPARLLLWLAAAVSYGVVWFALAAWVNAWGRGSIANAVILASCWLCFVMIVPVCLQLVGSWLYRLPAKAEIVEAERVAEQEERDRRARLNREEQDALVSAFLNENPQFKEPGALKESGRNWLFGILHGKNVRQQLDPHYRRFEEQRTKQARLLNAVRFLSPALLVQSALYDAAGAGPARHAHFLQGAEAYQREFERFLWPRLFTGGTISSTEFKDFPRFRYREEPLAPMMPRVLMPVAALLVMAALLASASWRGYNRPEVM